MARSAAAMTPRFDHAALLPMTATLHSERAGVKGGMQSASSRQATKSAGGGGTGGGDGGGGDGEDEDMLITRRRSEAASALSWHRVSGVVKRSTVVSPNPCREREKARPNAAANAGS